MAIGKSHRIVIEVDPALKAQIYDALRAQGMTLKEWFLQQAIQDFGLTADTDSKLKNGSKDEQ